MKCTNGDFITKKECERFSPATLTSGIYLIAVLVKSFKTVSFSRWKGENGMPGAENKDTEIVVNIY